MRRSFPVIIFGLSVVLLIACSGKKDTAASLAKKWCDLNRRVQQAPDGGPEYGRAKEALAKFESEMDRKYHRTDPLMLEIEKELEKCEVMLNGRK